MHLITSIDLSGPGFRRANVAEEAARILHHAAEQLLHIHSRYGSLNYEHPTQLQLFDHTGSYVGYVSTVEIDDIDPAVQERIADRVLQGSRPSGDEAGTDGQMTNERHQARAIGLDLRRAVGGAVDHQ